MKSLFFVLILFSVSCFKDPVSSEIPLNISTPDTNCSCLPTMDAYLWKGKTIYLKTFRGPACSWVPSFYDTKGNPFPIGNQVTLSEFLHGAIFLKNIWHCS